jgi:hypothetical protein
MSTGCTLIHISLKSSFLTTNYLTIWYVQPWGSPEGLSDEDNNSWGLSNKGPFNDLKVQNTSFGMTNSQIHAVLTTDKQLAELKDLRKE